MHQEASRRQQLQLVEIAMLKTIASNTNDARVRLFSTQEPIDKQNEHLMSLVEDSQRILCPWASTVTRNTRLSVTSPPEDIEAYYNAHIDAHRKQKERQKEKGDKE